MDVELPIAESYQFVSKIEHHSSFLKAHSQPTVKMHVSNLSGCLLEAVGLMDFKENHQIICSSVWRNKTFQVSYRNITGS